MYKQKLWHYTALYVREMPEPNKDLCSKGWITLESCGEESLFFGRHEKQTCHTDHARTSSNHRKVHTPSLTFTSITPKHSEIHTLQPDWCFKGLTIMFAGVLTSSDFQFPMHLGSCTRNPYDLLYIAHNLKLSVSCTSLVTHQPHVQNSL